MDATISLTRDASLLVWQYAKNHPYKTAIVVGNVGATAMLGPAGIAGYALNSVGFGPLGPVAGSVAATWQTAYGGFVPAGSVFSFLQWAGMAI